MANYYDIEKKSFPFSIFGYLAPQGHRWGNNVSLLANIKIPQCAHYYSIFNKNSKCSLLEIKRWKFFDICFRVWALRSRPSDDFVDEFICLFKTRSHDVMQRFRVLLTDYLNKRTEANNCILNCKPKIKHATGGRIGGRGGGETQGARQEVLNRLSVPYTTIALKRTRLNNPITPHGQTQQVNSISRSSHFQELLLNFD